MRIDKHIQQLEEEIEKNKLSLKRFSTLLDPKDYEILTKLVSSNQKLESKVVDLKRSKQLLDSTGGNHSHS